MEEPVNPASLGDFVRTNGLQLPFNMAQILSWIIMSFEICTIFLVLLPPLSLALKIVSGISISIFTILTCYNACKACIINPTDPRVLQAKEARARGEIVRPSTKLYCSVCRAYVLLRTKHCGACNRCVDVFDHHCIWLNNCIGNSNYKYFIRAVAALLITSILKLGFGIVVIVNYHVSSEDFQRNSQKYYNSQGRFNALYYIMIVSCVTNVVLFIVLGKLTTFHIWLYKKGLTTYESIIMKRTNSQHKKRPQTQTEASPTKSSRVIKNLEDEGSTAALNRTKNLQGITQTDNEIRLDTHLQDQTASKIDINPGLKSTQFELGSSETARFDTSPFIKKDSSKEKPVQKKNEKIKKIKNSHNNLRTSNTRQEDNSKENKQNETFCEEEKQDSQRNVILAINNEENSYPDSENRKSMSSNSNTNSSTSLIKGWSGKLFNKGPNLSRVFSIDSKTPSPSPTLTPENTTPGINREGGFGDSIERTSPIPFKVYTKVNALNLPEIRKEDEKGFDVSNLKSPCFGEPDVKNMTIDNKDAA